METPRKTPATIGEYLYWRYANLAMADAALHAGREAYTRTDYMIRARLYKGLCSGTMSISSLYQDEAEKLKVQRCAYCGRTEELTLDHLISRFSGGSDSGDNLVYACKSCNSAKKDRDLLVWYEAKKEFPPILVLRRYLKLAYEKLKEKDALELPAEELTEHIDVFRIDLIPGKIPPPEKLKY